MTQAALRARGFAADINDRRALLDSVERMGDCGVNLIIAAAVRKRIRRYGHNRHQVSRSTQRH